MSDPSSDQKEPVSAWNILRRYKGIADSETSPVATPETALLGLNVIREASNESSQNSTRKTSVSLAEPSGGTSNASESFHTSNWWFWNAQNPAPGASEEANLIKDGGKNKNSENTVPSAKVGNDISEVSNVDKEPISATIGSFFGPKFAKKEPVSEPTKSIPQESLNTSKTPFQHPSKTAQPPLQEPHQPNQHLQDTDSVSWAAWPSNYVSSWTSYTAQNGPTTENTPLITAKKGKPTTKDSKTGSDSPQPTGGWFSWIWSSNSPDCDTDDESASENSANSEAFRAAKLLIETFKDTTHYAIKQGLFETEIAVSGTQTESLPAKFNPKKSPLTPNEAQERSMLSRSADIPPPANNTSMSAPVTPNPNSFANNASTPAVMSSNSSVRLATANGLASVLESVPQTAVLPQLNDNLRTITLRTKLRLIAEHWLYRQHSSEKHIYRNPADILKHRHIRKVLVIGVHGFLPTKMVRSLIGQSTGTSVKFVQKATEAVDSWFEGGSHEYNVETIALEGGGRIQDRVSGLYKLLSNWSHLINESDVIFVAAHSQGVPVGIHLLAKMLTGGQYHLKHKKVGFLSMAGVNAGPFVGLDLKLVIRAYSTVENEIIGEIFEFQKPTSDHSLALNKSLGVLVSHNVKVTMAGALEDQFVPLYSSLGLNFHHPNIFRCTYVSSRGEVPPFIVTLFKIATTMKNLGFSDYGVFRDLGERCQGPTNDRGGHGRIFDSEGVYLQALRHTLETTNLQQPRELIVTPAVSVSAETDASGGQLGVNLYHIPWNIRGMIHDLVGVKNIAKYTLLHELTEVFGRWEPTKAWKDVKCCFDALAEMDVSDLLL